MNVLSCFDGISCGQLALKRSGIKVNNYYSSEIDKYAIKVTQANFPDTIQLGSITEVNAQDLPEIDLLIGGSPCQGFSFAGSGLNFEDPRSKLFFEYVRLKNELNPEYFLLENVKMKKQYQDIISDYLGVQPIEINSALVSAQNRKRLYWTNIPDIKQPEDKGILLKDIIEEDVCMGAFRGRYIIDEKIMDHTQKVAGLTTQRLELRKDDKSNTLTTVAKDSVLVKTIPHGYIKEKEVFRDKYPTLAAQDPSSKYVIEKQPIAIEQHNSKNGLLCVGALANTKQWLDDGKLLQRNFSQGERIYSIEGKCPTISANAGGTAGKGGSLITEVDNKLWRKLTVNECEKLQTIPVDYTNYISDSQRYKCIGNGWTVDVIVHIFKGIYNVDDNNSLKKF